MNVRKSGGVGRNGQMKREKGDGRGSPLKICQNGVGVNGVKRGMAAN